MKTSIRTKLVATYIFVALLTSTLVYGLAFFTSKERIKEIALNTQLIELAMEVQYWYSITKKWDGVNLYLTKLHPPPEITTKLNGRKRTLIATKSLRRDHAIVDLKGKLVTPYLHFKIGQRLPSKFKKKLFPIEYENKTIGWIVPSQAEIIYRHVSLIDSQEDVFFNFFNELLLVSCTLAVIVALFTGMALSNIFLAPIKALTKASDAIAQGKLLQNLPIVSNDEIGKLTRTFNNMSSDLVISDKQRRQLTSDIAHDLGTPIQIISGYVEMALDGSLPLTENKIKVINSEIEHIKHLLKDLNLLAETDTKTLSLNIEIVNISKLLKHVQAIYSLPCKKKKINLYIDAIGNLPTLKLDEERMIQIFGNLISNSIRYTPEFGVIKLEAQSLGNKLIFTVEDSGDGIAKKDLPFIFDRFYRGNTARNKDTVRSTNSGLGLTISKALIEMQGGTIKAASGGKNTGCAFYIVFPFMV